MTESNQSNISTDPNESLCNIQRTHSSGIALEMSQSNILDDHLLITPFYNITSTNNVLLWNKKTLRSLNKFQADGIWRLWDNYYAVIKNDLETLKTYLFIYLLTGKGMQRVKRVDLQNDTHNRSKEVHNVLGSKVFNSIYVIGTSWIGIFSGKNFDFQGLLETFGSNKKTFVNEDLKILGICYRGMIKIHPLTSTGMVSISSYWIPLPHRFSDMYIENGILSLLTTHNESKRLPTSVYITRFKITNKNFEEIEEPKALLSVETTGFNVRFLFTNKLVIYMNGLKFSGIVSIDNGKVLGETPREGRLIKVDSKEHVVYISKVNVLKKMGLSLV